MVFDDVGSVTEGDFLDLFMYARRGTFVFKLFSTRTLTHSLTCSPTLKHARTQGMFDLQPGPVQCTTTRASVTGASRVSDGSVVLVGVLLGVKGDDCSSVAPLGGNVRFSVGLSVAAESNATVAVAVRVGGAPDDSHFTPAIQSSTTPFSGNTEQFAAAPTVSWRRLSIALQAVPGEKVRTTRVRT